MTGDTRGISMPVPESRAGGCKEVGWGQICGTEVVVVGGWGCLLLPQRFRASFTPTNHFNDDLYRISVKTGGLHQIILLEAYCENVAWPGKYGQIIWTYLDYEGGGGMLCSTVDWPYCGTCTVSDGVFTFTHTARLNLTCLFSNRAATQHEGKITSIVVHFTFLP